MSKRFLTGEWRKLIMFNYEIEPSFITEFLPRQTELDLWNNTCYLSLVGFMFKETRVKGIRVPCHVNFEEVNLRFYVKYPSNSNEEYKRGVVFIKEIVPKPALSLVANTFFGEHYQTLPMRHEWTLEEDTQTISYHWKKNIWNSMEVKASIKSIPIELGSEAEFITEHYWGYTKLDELKTSEYEVKHPRWNIYDVDEYALNVDFEETYGSKFKFLNNQKPISVFLAEGSEIEVYQGQKIV